MDSQSKELLEAQAHLWNHMLNFIKSESLKCAVQLGIPDIINNHRQPISLTQLSIKLSIPVSKTSSLYRLMRLLVYSGFFATQKINDDQEQAEEEEGYVLTPASRLLVKDNPLSLLSHFSLTLDPIIVNPCHSMSDWFHNNDETSFETEHGSSYYEYVRKNPEHGNLFSEAMAEDTRLVMNVVMKNGKEIFEGLRSFVDVGGGTGNVVRAVSEAFPHLKCTLFDLPHVIGNLPKSNNIDYVGGDMFESIPSADAIFFKWILQDWTDEECVKILKRCKQAIPQDAKEGKVIIIDIVLEDIKAQNKSIETQLLFDQLMLVILPGKERNEKEWEKLFLEAGFSRYKINPILGLRSLIEVYP